MLALANMFCRKGRLILVQLVLITAGTGNVGNGGGLQGLLGCGCAAIVLKWQPLAQPRGQIMLAINQDDPYSFEAVLIWPAIILLISTLISILPARSATLISVGDKFGLRLIYVEQAN